MGNLAYGHQKTEEIAANVEEMLRKELGMGSPIPYTIEDGNASKTSLGSVLTEGASLLFFGREEVLLFALVFKLPGTREASLRVHVNRQGIGAHGGELLYTAKLNKKIAGELNLMPPKFLSSAKFEGDPQGAEKLNGNKDLIKQITKLARTKANVGGVDITIPLLVRIVPENEGSTLILATLPRMVSLGFSAMFDAQDFLNLAAAIEAAL